MEARAWVGKWMRAEEGTLSLSEGRLRFANEKRCLFDCQLNKIEKMVWQWYSFGGAFKVWIDGVSYLVSFVPRQSRLGSCHLGLDEGHRWRAALEGRPAPQSSPLGPRIFVGLLSLIQAFFYSVGGLMVMMQATDNTNAMWIRIVCGLMVPLLLIMIGYLLWQAVTTPFNRDP